MTMDIFGQLNYKRLAKKLKIALTPDRYSVFDKQKVSNFIASILPGIKWSIPDKITSMMKPNKKLIMLLKDIRRVLVSMEV
jgi:hypothetical protein